MSTIHYVLMVLIYLAFLILTLSRVLDLGNDGTFLLVLVGFVVIIFLMPSQVLCFLGSHDWREMSGTCRECGFSDIGED